MCVEKSLPSLLDIHLDLRFTLLFIRSKFSELFLMLLDLPLKFEPLLHGLVEGGLAGLGLPGPRLEQQQAANLLLDNQDC